MQARPQLFEKVCHVSKVTKSIICDKADKLTLTPNLLLYSHCHSGVELMPNETHLNNVIH